MAKPQKSSIERKNVKISALADTELDRLVDELYTAGVDVSKGAVVGALVFAARRLPIKAVAAVIPAYIKRQAAEAKKERG